MSNEQKTNSDQQQFWQMVLETFKTSNLSVRRFCKREGLSEPSFYSWRKKLSKDNDSTNEKREIDSSSFIKVSIPDQQSCNLEIVLTSGNILKIPNDFNTKMLTDILLALSKAGLC